MYINIETIINCTGEQNPTESVDLHVDQTLHPCSLIGGFLFTGASFGVHGFQMSAQWRLRSACLCTLERSVCVLVQLADEERYAWRYNDGESQTHLLTAWLRMLLLEFVECMIFYRMYWIPAQFIKKDDICLLRQYNKAYIIVKSIYLKLLQYKQCTQVH